MKNNCYSRKLISHFEFYGLKQLVNGPARVTEYSKSKIDLVASNCGTEVFVL